MSTHAQIHVGGYIRIPYEKEIKNVQVRCCVNPACTMSKLGKRLQNLRPQVLFCTACGTAIGEETVQQEGYRAYQGSDLSIEFPDEFHVIDGASIAGYDKDSEHSKFEYLIPNHSSGSLYPIYLDESGVFIYDEAQVVDDKAMFFKHYASHWARIKTEWPDAEFFNGIIVYHN